MYILRQFYQVILIKRFLLKVFPKVDAQLKKWVRKIRNFGSEELAHQAMASVRNKRFHCQDDSIYALYPGCDVNNMVELIVALQTISDYLDNLCDRTEVKEEKAFRQLHLSFSEALNPEGTNSDYYLYYPFKDDGGYLNELVSTCRKCISELPLYPKVKEYVLKLGQLYSELQIYKHLPDSIREEMMKNWYEKYIPDYPDISGWEFAAATGSTLCIFMLFAAASQRTEREDAGQIFHSYFPWICGLHILLDYFIDLEEDKEFKDLNFVSYYKNLDECRERLGFFLEKAVKSTKNLRFSVFHLTVIQGLLAMYLSDSKALQKRQESISGSLVGAGGGMAKLLWKMCRYLRKKHIL